MRKSVMMYDKNIISAEIFSGGGNYGILDSENIFETCSPLASKTIELPPIKSLKDRCANR